MVVDDDPICLLIFQSFLKKMNKNQFNMIKSMNGTMGLEKFMEYNHPESTNPI